jgi:flagellar basal-body rod protein FlgB
VDAISSALIIKALDGLHLRQAYTAQNIANAGSPDYVPVRVSFEDELRAAATQGLDAIAGVEARVLPREASPTSPELRLDLELAEAAQTSMRWRALIDLLGRQMSLERAIVTDGRR